MQVMLLKKKSQFFPFKYCMCYIITETINFKCALAVDRYQCYFVFVFGAMEFPCASHKVRHTLLICHHAAMMEINGLVARSRLCGYVPRWALATGAQLVNNAK